MIPAYYLLCVPGYGMGGREESKVRTLVEGGNKNAGICDLMHLTLF